VVGGVFLALCFGLGLLESNLANGDNGAGFLNQVQVQQHQAAPAANHLQSFQPTSLQPAATNSAK